MRLLFSTSARHNADTYREHDAVLWSQLQEALAAVRDQTPRSRETLLRVLGGTAWSVEVPVAGRDEQYQVVWACDPHDRSTAHIVHLGRRLH
ncbi:MAG: hypothetical protein FWH11_11900 [Micrococcales bacterium]|nr:hypothetical protein [Micrococcales bacterium]